MIDINEYIEKRKKDIEKDIVTVLEKEFCDSQTDRTDLRRRLKDYTATEMFAAELSERLSNDELYCLLSSPDAHTSETVIRKYKKYISKKRHQEKKKRSLNNDQGLSELTIEPDIDRIFNEISMKIRRHLKTENVKFDDANGIRRELKSVYARDFLNMIKGGMDEQLLAPWVRGYSNGHIRDINEAVVVELLKYNADIRSAVPNMRRSVLISHLKEHNDVKAAAAEIIRRLCEYFTEEKITDLLLRNRKYAEMIFRAKEDMELEQTAHRLILKEIPEDPIDLYPLARKLKRHFVLHIGPTNSGKTYEALQCFYRSDNGIYLAPLRLLAYEIFEQANINGVPCSMRTGEEHIDVPFSSHDSRTVEMLDFSIVYDVVVIDEAQLISDEERGGAWTAAILGAAARTIQVCAAPEAQNILIKLIEMCGDTYEVVQHKRSVPLVADRGKFSFPDSVREKDALIVFSKKSVLACAAVLQQNGIKASVIYGALPYDVRQNEVRRFNNEETDVVVATDAIGMGLNLPVQRIVFLETQKFDGKNRRPLSASEVQQISGRAGRRGMYDTGYYTVEFGADDINSKMNAKIPSIQKARLDFPEILIDLDIPLTTIMSKWNEMPDSNIFIKANLETELRLCKVLETFTDDKSLIYDFITIPFNENNSEIYRIWLSMAKEVIYDEITPPEERLIRIRDELSYYNSLNELEVLYQKCDLLYYFLTRFGYDTYTEEVCDLKRSISKKIINVLSVQQLEPKRCKICGTQLSWNYPYKCCEECYLYGEGKKGRHREHWE